MNKFVKISVLLFLISCFAQNANADMYLITHATYQGETGHSAIAIENYDILVKDTLIENKSTIIYDTLKNGTLTYYDFWPTVKEEFNIWTADKNVPSKFNRLPEPFASNQITEWSLMKLGIAKVNDQPCDGLIKIKLSVDQDFILKEKLDEVIQEPKAFNATKNNCSDFAKYAIEFISDTSIYANENILIKYQFTSPNKLFTKVSKMENASILKHPKSKIYGTFFRHKIIPILRTKILKYYKNQNHDTI